MTDQPQEQTEEQGLESYSKEDLINIINQQQESFNSELMRMRETKTNFLEVELPGTGNFKMQSPECTNEQLFLNVLGFIKMHRKSKTDMFKSVNDTSIL